MRVLEASLAPTFCWFFQRVSGLFLVMGIITHFLILHFFMERPVSFKKVLVRLESPGWVVFDILLLLTVTYHALNGIWNILLDYNPAPKLRRFYGWGLFFMGALIAIWGIYSLIPFTTSA